MPLLGVLAVLLRVILSFVESCLKCAYFSALLIRHLCFTVISAAFCLSDDKAEIRVSVLGHQSSVATLCTLYVISFLVSFFVTQIAVKVVLTGWIFPKEW